MEYILGLDPSLTATGLVILDRNQKIHAVKTIFPNCFEEERLIFIRDWVRSATYNLSVKMAAIEGYSYASIGNLPKLGEIGGILRVLLHEMNIPFVTVAPQTLKKWVTGKGQGQKNKMMLAAYKKWGVELDDDNQVDSYGLAMLAHSMYFGGKRKSYEKEVLEKIEKTFLEKYENKKT